VTPSVKILFVINRISVVLGGKSSVERRLGLGRVVDKIGLDSGIRGRSQHQSFLKSRIRELRRINTNVSFFDHFSGILGRRSFARRELSKNSVELIADVVHGNLAETRRGTRGRGATRTDEHGTGYRMRGAGLVGARIKCTNDKVVRIAGRVNSTNGSNVGAVELHAGGQGGEIDGDRHRNGNNGGIGNKDSNSRGHGGTGRTPRKRAGKSSGALARPAGMTEVET
jgi:hypothetical protein